MIITNIIQTSVRVVRDRVLVYNVWALSNMLGVCPICWIFEGGRRKVSSGTCHGMPGHAMPWAGGTHTNTEHGKQNEHESCHRRASIHTQTSNKAKQLLIQW